MLIKEKYNKNNASRRQCINKKKRNNGVFILSKTFYSQTNYQIKRLGGDETMLNHTLYAIRVSFRCYAWGLGGCFDSFSMFYDQQ